MIRGVSNCPYCGDLSAGVDDDGPALVLAPDRAGGRPCGHLAFLSVSLAAYDQTHRLVPGRTGHWLWVRGEGTWVLPGGPTGGLAAAVEEIVCGMVAVEPPSAVEYRVGGATAGCREIDRPGSGEFPLARRGGPGLVAVFDAHGLYGPDPDALVAHVRWLAKV